MATTRIKDLSKTATTVNSDANLVLDGNTGGTQKISRDNFRQDTADAFVAAPGTYNLAPLNSGTGKIDAVYLSSSSDTPKGAWDASTNTPTLADGSGTAGDYYDVTVAGSSDLGSGSIAFTVGDVVKYNGTVWFKIDSVANILDGVSTIDGAKTAIEIPDVGTAPNEVPLNGMLGDMAFQSSDGVSAAKIEVESTTGTATTQALTVTDGTDTNFVVQEDGKVGIGGNPSTTNPLRVSSSDATTPQALIQSNTSTGDAALSFNVSGRTFSLGIDKSDSEKFKISRSSELGNTDYVTIDGGRLGIGNSSPGSYNAAADDLVVGNSSTATASGATIATVGGGVGSLYFADSTSGDDRYRGYVQYNHGSNSLLLGTNAATRWTINSTGNLVAGANLGIDFGSTNTNTGVTVTGSVMSEYEQGTFTPKLADAATGGNVATYSTNAGDYIRVGNQVFFALRLIDINTTGLTSGNTIYITDMPYQCKSGSSFVPCNVMADSLTFTGQVTATLQGGVSYLILKEFSSGGADASLTVSAISSGVTDLFITGSYLVA